MEYPECGNLSPQHSFLHRINRLTEQKPRVADPAAGRRRRAPRPAIVRRVHARERHVHRRAPCRGSFASPRCKSVRAAASAPSAIDLRRGRPKCLDYLDPPVTQCAVSEIGIRRPPASAARDSKMNDCHPTQTHTSHSPTRRLRRPGAQAWESALRTLLLRTPADHHTSFGNHCIRDHHNDSIALIRQELLASSDESAC